MEYSYNDTFKGVFAKPNSAEEWLEFIWDIGADYDGYNDVKNLKNLIDEMVDAACEGRHCLKDGHIFYDEEADEISRQKAIAEAKTFKKNKEGTCPNCGYHYMEFTNRDRVNCPKCKTRFNIMEV